MFKQIYTSQPDNSEQDSVALAHGSAFTLVKRGNQGSKYLLTSSHLVAREYRAKGWRTVGEIHSSDFQGSVGYDAAPFPSEPE